MRKISLALSLLLLAGCAQFTNGFNADGDGASGRYYDPYAQSDLDELLVFGANMANIPASSRAEVCRLLLKRQKESPGAGIQLHLMVGRLLSDSCGDISGILDKVGAIPPASLTDERLQKLVAIHKETLKRMNALLLKRGALKRKQKTDQTLPETNEATGSKQDENRLLREKLEAIRSLEKHLDESGGGN